MVIDSSALIAILLREPEGDRIRQAMRQGMVEGCAIAAPTLLESSIVIFARKQKQGSSELDLLCRQSALDVEPFDERLMIIARDAYMRYGKASGHPAKLNFGDFFSYALAKQRNDALLCVGKDFSHTDLQLISY